MMWIRLQLNSVLPSISFLIGKGGMLYVKLKDIGHLLMKSSSYSYREEVKSIAVQGRDILPLDGFKIPPQPLKTYFVPIGLASKLISLENTELAELFMNRLSKGIAHKQGKRQFVSSERKSPLLVCVEQIDDKCVSVPLWMGEFIKDLEKLRAKVSKHYTLEEPSSATQTKRKSEKEVWNHFKTRMLHPESDDEEGGRLIIDLNPPAECDTRTSMENEPKVEHFPEPPVLSLPELNSTVESLNDPPAEPLPEQNSPPPREPLLEQPIDPRREPSATPILRTLLPNSEPISSTEPLHQPFRPVEPKMEPVETTPTSASDPTVQVPVTTFPVSFVDMTTVTFHHSNGLFPEPGDLIVRFQTLPNRVFFVLGENNLIYRVIKV